MKKKRKPKQPTPGTARGLLLPMKGEVVDKLLDHCKDKPEGLHRWAIRTLVREAEREQREEKLNRT